MEDSNKFTKGPWMVSASGHTVYALHGNPPRNRFSALVQSGRSDDAPDEELAANARLMAAAPDLLEALQECVKAWHEEDRVKAWEKGRAAISKATGA